MRAGASTTRPKNSSLAGGICSREYGIETAYIFGSATRPYKFHQNSDVDLGVEEIDPIAHFSAISLLSAYLEREVDIIRLDSCHFAHRIRSTGILWKRIN